MQNSNSKNIFFLLRSFLWFEMKTNPFHFIHQSSSMFFFFIEIFVSFKNRILSKHWKTKCFIDLKMCIISKKKMHWIFLSFFFWKKIFVFFVYFLYENSNSKNIFFLFRCFSVLKIDQASSFCSILFYTDLFSKKCKGIFVILKIE